MMHAARRGLSLAELLVAMAISTIVLGGAVAAIGMAGRTFQSATSGLQATPALDGLARMSADLELAIRFEERTTTVVAFYVPDRTGDGAPDLLRYAWGGNDGDPITLSLNGSPASTVVPSVSGMSLAYLVASVPADPMWAVPTPSVSDTKVFDRGYTGSGTVHTLSLTSSVAAIIQPVPGGSDNRFRVTRAKVRMQGKALGSDVSIALHRVNMMTATPQSGAIVATTVRQADLPDSMQDVEVELPNTVEFSQGDFIAIVVSQKLVTSAGEVALEPSPQYLTDGWIATTDLLGQWKINATKDLAIQVYAETWETP